MKLRLTFIDDYPTPINVIEDTFKAIDKRLFAVEKKRLKQLRVEFPSITKEQIATCKKQLETSYRAKAFTMLEVESVETGSLIFTAGVTAAVYSVVQSTIGTSLTDAFKETEMHRQLKRFFLIGQGTSLIQAVKDVAFKFRNKNAVARLAGASDVNIPKVSLPSTKYIAQHTFEDIEASHNLSKHLKVKPEALEDWSKLIPSKSVYVASPLPDTEFEERHLPPPTDSPEFISIEAKEPPAGNPYLDVQIKTIRVKVPPISYGKLADEYNFPVKGKGDAPRLEIDE